MIIYLIDIISAIKYLSFLKIIFSIEISFFRSIKNKLLNVQNLNSLTALRICKINLPYEKSYYLIFLFKKITFTIN